MTETPEILSLPAIGPGPDYQGRGVWLPQLYLETTRTGSGVIENRTFTDCIIEGPAVLFPLGACTFESCDLGAGDGAPSDLTFIPGGPKRIIGAVPLRNCSFIRCRFSGVAFTGNKAFLDKMVRSLTGDAA